MSGHQRRQVQPPLPRRDPRVHLAQAEQVSPLAPDRVPRPRPRPANLGPRTPGMYDGMDMRDETGSFGRLGTRQRRGDPSEVVLHQTASDDADSTRRAYEQRIQQGSSIGAHYLIDQDGATSLTVPTDRVVSHARGHNSHSIGIENVGAPARVNGGGDLHAQIEALDLSPGLKARLLAMSPAELRQTMRDNNNNIYEDISGPQKRANWLLLQRLAAEHDLDLGEDVHAHEHINAKTIGEGENIEEFIDTMVAWPGRIEDLEERVAQLAAGGGVSPERLAELQAYLEAERARKHAVDVDGTVAERNALDGERLLGQTDGPAHERERVREDFYDDFYGHMGRLDEALS